ncbi:MAG TPA: hypothetical protein VFE94_03840, partial [Candidatus Paceibacterota bacterium]|nr:hypothetical protein [Candidatus Paceibacterota bacterium]
YIGSSLMAFPNYIPYYNALAGGTENGYKIAVDSNYDWGQDFYRLLDFVEANNIQKVYLDYFGGEDPAYWLGNRYAEMRCGDPNRQQTCARAKQEKGWVAVSANQLMGGTASPVTGFDQPTGYYAWLLDFEPTRLGTSIFIYNIK